MDRRNALKSMIALAAAPTIIKVEMLMPVKMIIPAEPGLPMSGVALIQKLQDDFNREMFWANFVQQEIASGHSYLKLNGWKI